LNDLGNSSGKLRRVWQAGRTYDEGYTECEGERYMDNQENEQIEVICGNILATENPVTSDSMEKSEKNTYKTI